MKSYIVAGANGFIGSKLVSRLLQSGGGRILAIDVTFEQNRMPQDDRVSLIEIKTDKIEDILSFIPDDDYTAFYNLAWRGVNGPEKADVNIQLNNIKLAVFFADLAKRINCDKYLCSGTIAEQSVNSLPLLEKTSGGMLYGVAKHSARLFLEYYCKNIGLPLVWMQFSNIYGVGNKTGNLISYTLNEILSDRDATFGPAEQPYDFIYIDDLIEAVVRLGESNNQQNFYYIGSGQPRTLKDYLKEIGRICHKEDRIRIGVRPDDGIKYSFSMFDNSPLKADIGDYISVPFEEGVRRTVVWYNTQN